MEPFFHMNIEKNEKPEVTDQLSFTDQARRNKCATQSIISLKTVHFGVSFPLMPQRYLVSSKTSC